MIKTILVPASGDASDTGCLDAALTVARAFAAHIDVLHVRIDPVDVAIALTSEPSGAPLIEGMIAQLEQDAAQREAATRRVFEDFCARARSFLSWMRRHRTDRRPRRNGMLKPVTRQARSWPSAERPI